MILMQSAGMLIHHIHRSIWLKAVAQLFSCSYLVRWTTGRINVCFQIIFEHGSRDLPTLWVWSQVPIATVVVEVNHCSPVDPVGL